MESGPLPPHERAWRHPSELGPTAGDVVDDSSASARALALTTGAVTAVIVAVLVVSFTPDRSDAPTAISATTVPAVTLPAASIQVADDGTTAAAGDAGTGAALGEAGDGADDATAAAGVNGDGVADPTDAIGLDAATSVEPGTGATAAPVAVSAGADAGVRLGQMSVTRDQQLALTGAPLAVSAAPAADDAAGLDPASEVPADDDPIVLLTESHTYDLTWGELSHCQAPDGAIVITPDGGLVASFVDGELRLLVD